MLLVYLKGLAAGILAGISFGPAFFANVNASISRGFKAGMLLAIGISITDTSYAMISVYGLSGAFQSETVTFWVSLIGGIVIIVFGALNFRKPIQGSRSTAMTKRGLIKYFFQGILINGLNPFVAVFWAGAVSAVYLEMELEQTEAMVFFAGMLTTILSLDLTKAALSSHIYHFIGSSRIHLLSKAVGIIFILIGLSLLSSAIID